MPNLLTQYNNGTFEDLAATWDALIANVNSFERSADYAYEGVYSGKLELTKINSQSYWQVALFAVPAVGGSPYEFTLRIRVDSNIDDRIYLMAYGIAQNDTTNNISIPVRCSDAKDGFIELRVNFTAKLVDLGNGFGPQAYVVLLFMKNFRILREDAPNLFIQYPNLEEFVDYNQVGDYNDFDENDPIYLDAAYVDLKLIPAIPDPQFVGRKLYYVKNVFLLSDGSNIYPIQEPIRWDQVLIQIKFDESTFRYKYEFSDKDVLLEFDEAAGRAIIEEQWRLKGTDANCSLKFGELDEAGNLTIHFEAALNFESRIATAYVTKMNCERRSFAELLRTRFDTKTNIFATQTIDGTALPPLPRQNIFLHPRLLKYEAIYNYNPVVSLVVVPDEEGDNYKMIPPFRMISSNIEGAEAPTPPDGQIYYPGVTLPAGVTNKAIAVSMTGLSFEFDITEGVPQQVFTRVSITRYSDTSTSPVPHESATDFQEHGLLPKHVVVTSALNGNFKLGPDDSLRITIFIGVGLGLVVPPPVINIKWRATSAWSMRILERTVFSASKIQGVRIFEAINRQLAIVTDQPNVLKSNFFGRIDLGYDANGCGYNHYLMNGLLVRGFTDKAYPLSTKDWFTSLSGIFCMGMSIERDNDNNEFARVELLEYFFRPILLLTLNTISDYEEEVADDYTFNELEIGFKKYPQDNQQDSLNDWMTRFSFVGPLKLIQKKFSKMIDFLLSPYYIEYTRREGFAINPTNSYETDNDTFMISCNDEISEIAEVRIDSVDNQIIIYGIVPIKFGDVFTLTGTPIDGNYTAYNVEIPFEYDRTIVTLADDVIIADSSTLSATVSFEPVVMAKRTEDFSSVTGIDFSASVYNLEHHLKRILLRWAKYFQAGWDMYIRENQPLKYMSKFVEGANNMNLRTVSTNPCQAQGAIDDDAWLDILNVDKPLFGKTKYSFKAPLTWTTVNYIRKAFEGRSPDNKNYGYIRFKNPDNVYKDGFILEMKFNPVTLQTSFVLIEKFNING
jgi:hypothetical protein